MAFEPFRDRMVERGCQGKQSGTLERVPDLGLRLERKTGFEPATLTLAKVRRSVGLRRLVPLSSAVPVGSSADSAESARFREPWFSALNEPGFAESPSAVPSRRPKQNRRTTGCDRPLVRPILRAEHQARFHKGRAPPSVTLC